MNCVERFISKIDKDGVAVKVLSEESSIKLLTFLEESNIKWASGNEATYRHPYNCYIVIRPIKYGQSLRIFTSHSTNLHSLERTYLVFSSVDDILNVIPTYNTNLEIGDLL